MPILESGVVADVLEGDLPRQIEEQALAAALEAEDGSGPVDVLVKAAVVMESSQTLLAGDDIDSAQLLESLREFVEILRGNGFESFGDSMDQLASKFEATLPEQGDPAPTVEATPTPTLETSPNLILPTLEGPTIV